jgi:FHA domain
MDPHRQRQGGDAIVVLGPGDSAGRWAEALTRAGMLAVVADPFSFVPPSQFAPSPIRLAVVDSALDVAPSLLQAVRAAGVPAILATSARAPVDPNRDPLTHYGSWLADAYVGTPEELVNAVPIVLEPQTNQDGKALHLTYRGSIPPMDVSFPIGTAFPLHEGAACFLGRSRSSTVNLASPHVGRQHALVAAIPSSESKAVCVDLQSHNGTFIRGRRVPMDILSPGDEMAIAGYRFVLEALPDYSA